jgi:hypothetical protein
LRQLKRKKMAAFKKTRPFFLYLPDNASGYYCVLTTGDFGDHVYGRDKEHDG